MTIFRMRWIYIGTLIALAIACALFGGMSNPVDVALIRDGIAARAASPVPLEIGLFLNYAGGVAATLGVGAVGTLLLLRRGERRSALAFAAIIFVGRLLVEALKLLVHRARPALDPHPVVTHSLSFPSAHAANSMIALSALALFFAPPSRRTQALAAAVLASLAIGASRSLIGVHWPSDVAAGWAIGAAWVVVCWPLAERLSADEAQHDIVGGHRDALIQG